MAQYSEDGRVIVPPKGMKITSRDWDDICRENEVFEKYHDEPVYSFGGGETEFWEEVKIRDGYESRIVKRKT